MITLSLDEVCDVVSEMLDELAATTPIMRPQRGTTIVTDRLLISISIDIVGPFTTTVMVLRIELAEALQLAAAMLGEPLTAIDQATADETMGEIANVIAGGVKGLFAEETYLGVPTPTHVVGKLGELQHAGIVDHELGRFEVGLVDAMS